MDRSSENTARCTFRTIRSITRNFISLRAIWAFRILKRDSAASACWCAGTSGIRKGARLASLGGANIIFYPTAIGWHPSEKQEFGAAQLDAWRTIQRSHAIANGVFVAAVNRVGFEGSPESGLEFWGHSFVSDPFGRVLAEGSADKEEILIVECDPARIEETRRNWPFLRDRRIDAYSPILERWHE